MDKDGEIVIIEDDPDDQMLFEECYKSLDYKNRITFFCDGQKALDHLKSENVNPFLIISDINLPKLDGFQLREMVKTETPLQVSCVPYIFFSTTAHYKAVLHAYNLSAQGFFTKPNSVEELKEIIHSIIHYWKKCSVPLV